MALEDWDLNASGEITLCSLTGFEMALPYEGVAVAVQVQFVRSEEQLAKREYEHLQLGMTVPQAAEFAQALLRAVERAMQRPTEREN
jgi:hypothetical protein